MPSSISKISFERNRTRKLLLGLCTTLIYMVLALVSFVIIIGLYEGVIVRVPFLRFVFGM